MYGKLPKEIMAEILFYLAEHEDFKCLKGMGTVSPKQFKEALGELAESLKLEARAEAPENEVEILKNSLKKSFQNIVEKLSPEEQERLFRGFVH